jgi:hypothetical protein
MITMINWQIVFGHYSPLVWFCFVIFESLPKYINGCCLTLIDSQENENSNVWNSSLKIKTITLFSFFYFEDVVSIAGAQKKKEYIYNNMNM